MGRKTQVTVALAAVALVAAGAVLVFSSGPDSPDPTSDSDLSVDLPLPPAGMRWVGYADQVVAVPNSWTTDDAPCNVPQSDTVYVAFPGEFFCATPATVPRGVVRADQPDQQRAGVHDRVPRPPARAADPRTRSWRSRVDWTTVPWRLHGSAMNMARELRREGLSAEIVREYLPEATNGKETTPSSGTPIRRGTTISVVDLPVDGPMVIRQAIAAPGDVLDVGFPEGAPHGVEFVMSLRNSRRIAPQLRMTSEALDQLVLPDDVAPGLYRICVDATSVCDALTVAQ